MTRIYAWWASWADLLGGLWRSRRLIAIASAGQGLVEYALVVTLVAVLAIAVLLFLGGHLMDTFNAVGGDLANPTMTAGPTPGPTAKPTATPKPTKTPKPTATPKPTKTPKPTPTP
jgi:Flp pilus assembly pilin Flp